MSKHLITSPGESKMHHISLFTILHFHQLAPTLHKHFQTLYCATMSIFTTEQNCVSSSKWPALIYEENQQEQPSISVIWSPWIILGIGEKNSRLLKPEYVSQNKTKYLVL